MAGTVFNWRAGTGIVYIKDRAYKITETKTWRQRSLEITGEGSNYTS